MGETVYRVEVVRNQETEGVCKSGIKILMTTFMPDTNQKLSTEALNLPFERELSVFTC